MKDAGMDVAQADQCRDMGIARSRQHDLGRAVLQRYAAFEDAQPIGQKPRLAQVVGDHDDRDADALAQLDELVVQCMARRLVDRLRYPPRGSRGVAARRASGYDVPDTSAGGERGDPICMVQIESPDAVRAAAEIASVDGIDALVVGCADLAVALQGSVDVATRGMREAIGRVRDAAAAAGIVAGLAGPDDPALLRAVAGEGCSLFLCSADVRLYAQAVAERVSALRSELAAPESGRAGFGVRA